RALTWHRPLPSGSATWPFALTSASPDTNARCPRTRTHSKGSRSPGGVCSGGAAQGPPADDAFSAQHDTVRSEVDLQGQQGAKALVADVPGEEGMEEQPRLAVWPLRDRRVTRARPLRRGPNQ